MALKRCRGCDNDFPIDVFGACLKRGVLKPYSRCPDCTRIQQRAKYVRNRDIILKANKQRYQSNRDTYLEKNHERYKQRGAEYRKHNREKVVVLTPDEQLIWGKTSVKHNTYHAWINRLKRKGLDPDMYATLLKTQGFCCGICRAPTPGRKGMWAVDHCHGTGQARGLLCHRCNLAIGLFADNPGLMRAAATYLDRYQDTSRATGAL